MGSLTVVWQPHLCIHSGVCFRSLPGVFKPRERPWIQLNREDLEETRHTVHACPSGALSIKPLEADPQPSPDQGTGWHKVSVMKNGPLRIREACRITLADGTVVEKPNGVSLCRCGGSADKPFCDGSHRVNGFTG